MRKQSATNTPIATRQSLAPSAPAAKKDSIIEYKDFAGSNVKLSIDIIRRYICPSSNLTDAEAMMFLMLCKHQGLNPFVRDAYCVKYGNQATMVVGRDAFTKKAQKNPKYKGMSSGVIVLNLKGEIENRKGEIVLDDEELLGGWAEVYIDGWVDPLFISVNFNEYVQMKDGKPNAMWSGKPATMIRKVAVVHALREAFPADLSGCYSQDELGVDDADLPKNTVPQPNEAVDVDYEPVADPATGEVTDEDEQGDIFG